MIMPQTLTNPHNKWRRMLVQHRLVQNVVFLRGLFWQIVSWLAICGIQIQSMHGQGRVSCFAGRGLGVFSTFVQQWVVGDHCWQITKITRVPMYLSIF